ncbi:MAG TPA: toll/interleukin-1 receptor domain-containing protein [Thiobacillus sp.]|jgi:hypothetical protein|nr:toll/interleukin-1 receptor domain-containing protein [Thiobacillus sp.]
MSLSVPSSDKRFQATVTGLIATNGALRWHLGERPVFSASDDEGLLITFPLHSEVKSRHALRPIREALAQNGVTWLREERGRWIAELDDLFAFLAGLRRHPWLKGRIEPTVEIDVEEELVFGEIRRETVVRFLFTKTEVEASMSKRIFLSHKGVDKPLVREYFQVLKTIGFDPWLDEDAMVAGVPLERALLNGMKDSCAAVFFVTPDYRDEDFLASEVNYAMIQKREKGERFAIITLVLKDSSGKKGVVPELLQQYVWKEPDSSIGGLNEILRALPIQITHVGWKT